MKITIQDMADALADIQKYGGCRAASRATGLTYGHYQRRLEAAKKWHEEYSVEGEPEPEDSAPTVPGINDRILVISDLHAPYQHKDALDFLAALHAKYDFTRIINIGDELDYHALSYHDSDPDLDSAGRELQQGRYVLWELEKMFPVMQILDSNHGSLVARKGRTHGFPSHVLKEYRDIIFGENCEGVMHRPGSRGEGWTWHPRLVLDLPNRGKCVFVHQGVGNALTNTKNAGTSFVQGHFHSKFEIAWHGTPEALNFSATVGCLIDDESLAFGYNKIHAGRPIIGCGMIIDGQPRLMPMNLAKGGRWTGFVG